MQRHRFVLLAASLAAVVSFPTRSSAQIALSPGSWSLFEFFDGAGSPVDGSGFTAQSSTNPLRIRVTDAFVAGDAYDVFVDGILTFGTPSVQGVGYSPDYITEDPDLAFGNPQLSWFEYLLAPREDPYLITLNVREAVPDEFSGAGFIRFDEAEVDGAPEPGSLVLLGTGLLGLAGIGRRRILRAIR